MGSDWPVSDPPNVLTFTLRSVAEKQQPILLVVHDDDDGGWQFLDGSDVRMENAMLVCLKNVVKIDDSIVELADLPLGWYAHRATPSDPWIRAEKDW